jgi:hypothetical protein
MANRVRGENTMSEVRLYISTDPKLLIGGADVGAAITKRNSALADEVATALRRAGYRGGLLVLDADDLPLDDEPRKPFTSEVPFRSQSKSVILRGISR